MVVEVSAASRPLVTVPPVQRSTTRPPRPDEFRVSGEAVVLLVAVVVVTVAGTVLAVWSHRRRLGRGRGARR